MKKLDKRQVKSQKKLHHAYLKMLKQNINQFTIQELCDLAEVTRPTFYRLYKDVQELRYDIHKTLLIELKNALTIKDPKPLNESSREEMSRNLKLFFQHIYTNRTAYEIFFVNQPDAVFINEVKEVIQRLYVTEGLDLNRSNDNLLPIKLELISAYITGAHTESVVFWIKEGFRTSPEEMADDLIKLSVNTAFIKNKLES